MKIRTPNKSEYSKKLSWSSIKDKETGYTIITVTDGKNSLQSSHRPYMVRSMTGGEFLRIVQILIDAMEASYGPA